MASRATTVLRRCLSLIRGEKHLPLYFLIGATAAVIDLVLFSAGHRYLKLSESTSNIVSVHVATLWSFTLNGLFNFRVSSHPIRRFVSFYLVTCVGLLVGTSIIVVFSVYLSFSPDLVKLSTLPLVFLLQYSLNRSMTFSSRITGDFGRQPAG